MLEYIGHVEDNMLYSFQKEIYDQVDGLRRRREDDLLERIRKIVEEEQRQEQEEKQNQGQ